MKKEKAVNYVKSRNKKLLEQKFKHFSVMITHPLPENIDVRYVFEDLENLFPAHFLKLIDIVYIGKYSFFEKRKINAMFSDGAMYISNDQDNNLDLKDDIVHELAHAIEDKYDDYIYYDEKIKNEYFTKLKKLKNYLTFEKYDLRGVNFFNEQYSKEFDDFLLKDVGYEKLTGYSKDMFLTPYSITSLREYFATGFEQYFIGNKVYLKQLCPYVYKKLYLLTNNVEDLEQHEY